MLTPDPASPSKKQKITVTEQGSPVALSLQPKPMEIGLEVDSNTAEFEISESVKSAEPTEETIQNTAKMPEGPSKPSKHLGECFLTLIIALSKGS